MIIKNIYYFFNWITDLDFLNDWIIKFISNKWTNNETNLDWIQHFNKYTKNHSTNVYQMLIIDSHNNHIFTKFNEYCKFNNIIFINMFAHSFHLLQSLNVGLYSFLKFAYGCQINFFICVFINHIIKIEFFITYLATHNAVFTKKILKENQRYWNFILKFKFCYFKIKCLFLYINIFFISFKI